MRILFNATTMVKGGGVQAATEFCNQLAINEKENTSEWHLLLSNEVQRAIENRGIGVPFPKYVFLRSPARSLETRRQIKHLEKKLQPNCVFTFYGPSYVAFESPHVCGLADPWVTHADHVAYKALPSFVSRAQVRLLSAYKAAWFKTAQKWITEAPIAKAGFVRRFGISPDDVSVISNCCGQHYFSEPMEVPVIDGKSRITVLTLSAYYPHKNLELIPKVAAAIRRVAPQVDIEFVITLPPDDGPARTIGRMAKRLGVSDMVRNVGPVNLSDGPALYKRSLICFMPTVLEVFSASYVEAMAMSRPIVTSDLPFARDICSDAALYFRPFDPNDAAAKLLTVIRTPNIAVDLVRRGRERLHNFDTPSSRYQKTMQVLEAAALTH